MDALTSTTATAAAPDAPATPATGNNKLGKNEFLKIFMAQLGQQDPTAPMDSRDFVAQLAQFTSLEQAQNMSSTLDNLLLGQAGLQQTSMTNLIGKDVLFRTDQVQLADGQGASAGAELSAHADSVSAVISDATGHTVRTIQLGAHDAGSMSIPWDGRDDGGKPLPAGVYTVKVAASDKAGKSVAVEQRDTARVTGISFHQGVPELMLGARRIKTSDIVQINERSTP